MLYLILSFAVIGYYQSTLHRSLQSSRRDRGIAYSVTGLAFIYCALGHYWPEQVNPNIVIRYLFEPFQSWLL